tara:strand:- start:470783 stop:471625 length:843 start_codon:yes stop_codon:yes gene_type:complete
MKTRFAPSPTGSPHLGSLRTAYQNWLAARSTGGSFVVRIDDTDKSRSKAIHTKEIVSMLGHFGLDYDDLVHQSDRIDIYNSYIDRLIADGWASDNGYGVVLSDLRGVDLDHWTDGIAGQICISDTDKSIAGNKILRKQDGTPTYNFATVIDDIELGIDCVIRGKDHTTNTSFQAMLFAALGADLPDFYHVGLIMHEGRKLSKRDDGLSLDELMKSYHPDAILNCVARLGWSPTTDDKTTKLLPKDRMIEMFWGKGKLRNNNANFDLDKLKAWDRKYRARA